MLRVAVIPAYNEEKTIGKVVRDACRHVDRVIVVDDGSKDDCAGIARKNGALTLVQPINMGKGFALSTGCQKACELGAGAIVLIDGDGQHDPADIDGLLDAVRGGADLVLGSRSLAPQAFHGGTLRRTGRRVFALLCRALTGLRLTDPTSGLKALGPRAQALFALSRFPDRFPDADALVLAQRARLVIAERPARMRQSRNRHSMHDGLRAVSYTFNMLLSLLVAAIGREQDLGG
jgi:glycosyltransferase involved in cell wall biosynthesis